MVRCYKATCRILIKRVIIFSKNLNILKMKCYYKLFELCIIYIIFYKRIYLRIKKIVGYTNLKCKIVHALFFLNVSYFDSNPIVVKGNYTKSSIHTHIFI